jgi:hypothetical protein
MHELQVESGRIADRLNAHDFHQARLANKVRTLDGLRRSYLSVGTEVAARMAVRLLAQIDQVKAEILNDIIQELVDFSNKEKYDATINNMKLDSAAYHEKTRDIEKRGRDNGCKGF